jgi:hypothetical protein
MHAQHTKEYLPIFIEAMQMPAWNTIGCKCRRVSKGIILLVVLVLRVLGICMTIKKIL